MPPQVKTFTSDPPTPRRRAPRQRSTQPPTSTRRATEKPTPEQRRPAPGLARSAAGRSAEPAVARRWERIYAVVRRIPRGRVATYGQVAAMAGLPRHARQVGYALHALPRDSDVPWHRVINARGEISPRSTPGWDGVQRALLRRERVLARDGGVDLDRFRWEPGDP
jgi:methylated-DNA-protein-cysteine methyltransferase-like protein